MSQPIQQSPQAPEEIPECARCGKPVPLCICDTIEPIESGIELLILQHPQEQSGALGTARLTAMHFANATVKVGLSWPSLSKILGRSVDPSRWAVLYLGSAKVAALDTDDDIVAIGRKGQIEEGQRAILKGIEGVVLLDGTWSQAKALWWRNAWMLKCRRIILGPAQASRYGRLRREPRRDGLSTIEAAAMVLARLDGRAGIEATLLGAFERMLAKYQQVQESMPELAPRPKSGSRPGRASRKRKPRRENNKLL